MVKGIEKFIEKFRAFPDCYTIIGGAACDILMNEQERDFRATKDIDMILILEDNARGFAKAFWEFIREGNYKCGWKNSEQPHFYRFTEPAPGFPAQIELFSRMPNYHLEAGASIIPIYYDDDISSLSAILLNDNYYEFMKRGRRQVAGASVLSAGYLIPFKMYAWLDLTKKKENGEHVNEKDLKKHKLDVFRLLEIVPVDSIVNVESEIAKDIERFISKISEDDLDHALKQIGVSLTKEQGVQLLKRFFLSEKE